MNKIRFPKTKRSGFSLIELLIVIAIIGIMSGVALKSFDSGQKTKTELEIEGLKLSAIIAAQKNDALSGKKTDLSCGNDYTVAVDSNKLGYTVSGCNSMSSQKLKSGITFTDASVGKNVTFTAPLAAVTTTTTPPAFPVNFVLKKGSYKYTVSVFESGNITQAEN